ncbi:uncharacterized protein LOC124795011 [Schistocerca piceifrons]|uniref:uncharacterized protein LOC124795011 n=1 Tax=Schistocerca piceifrons TaxID=274613 RepID=UPI001F5EF95D|nr:uncharacterized protein LOC124795011 [Schistocerca piceifrons]
MESLVHPELPFTSRIILHLFVRLQQDCPAQGRHRYYTSLQLVEELKKEKTHLTGTIMANRKGLPVKVKRKQLSKLKNGDMKAFENAVAIILAWKDKRPGLMESTHHKDAMQEITQKKRVGSKR